MKPINSASEAQAQAIADAIALIKSVYSVEGTPSEVIVACALLPSDPTKRHVFATRELAVKDSLIKTICFYTGTLPIGRITEWDGTSYEFCAPQPVYLHKSEKASLDKNLTNKCFKLGGVDGAYDPVGPSSNVDNSGADPALMAEFAALVTDIGLTSIVRDGRSPIKIRCLIPHNQLVARYPEKIRLGVIESLLAHKLVFVAWIESDDDEKLGFVAERIKNS